MIATVDIINAEYDEANYMSDLMKALNPTPTGWSNKNHHCKWKGISCNSTTQAVTSIILPSSSLTGTLPPYLNNTLTNLTHIDLHNNSLNGPLPYFTNLFLLQTVSLGNNKFSSVPESCFYYIPHLRTLNLTNNLNLSGWEFPNLLNSNYLDTLDLKATNMIGILDPVNIFWFGILHTFFISHNKIRGNPLQFLRQSPIRYLQLNNNRFEGTISAISSMSNLSQAWLHNNMFSGRIPNMSNCTNLFDLQLQSNALIGFVPSSLLNLSSLKIIFLDNNKLHGPIPVFRKSVVNATWEPNNFCQSDVGPCDPQVMILLEIFEAFDPRFYLSIKGNDACNGGEWTDITPDLIKCERGKIVTFKMRDFELTGTISPAFSNLKSLVNLTLAGNNLNGSIPDSLKTLPQLQLLDVSNNNLSGVIPKFSSKVKLNTTGNAFLGQIMSRQGGGEHATTAGDVQTRGSSKANLKPFLIAGSSLISVGFILLIVIICKHWIYKDLELSNNFVDSLSNSEEENDTVRKITMVSLWCIQTNPSERPSMSRVLEMLQGPLQLVPYPPKPFLYSSEMPSLQISYESSNNLLETDSIT
ncbi:non-specific serine/threonine protein kinase [Trifolium repens]|nr:non-specific serine/threonine protein kinase [Trifolium repens]